MLSPIKKQCASKNVEVTRITYSADSSRSFFPKFRVQGFKLGKEFTHGLEPSGSCIFKTLTNAFFGVDAVEAGVDLVEWSL